MPACAFALAGRKTTTLPIPAGNVARIEWWCC